jgi:cardiolipin synthase
MWPALLSIIAVLFHLAGILSTMHALLYTRTSQGAIAWALCLTMFPYGALPVYWVFGRSKFHGYVGIKRSENAHVDRIYAQVIPHLDAVTTQPAGAAARFQPLANLVNIPFLKGNSAELLIDGAATFEAIFAAIDRATDYVLIQFFIIHDDELGRALQQHLIDRLAAGVRVFVLYDEVGSQHLGRAYIKALRDAGAEVNPFRTTGGGLRNKFQLNFRNHRKIVVVDGQTAFVGGHNVGDEYMGRNPKFWRWRDTHVGPRGPVVLAPQMTFVKDWYWATKNILSLNWSFPDPTPDDMTILTLPTGPADALDSCQLMFLHAVQSARQRIWIASPYFVPDVDLINALQLAALRGVDVRILLPAKIDHLPVYLAGFSYLEPLNLPGIQFMRFTDGFLHQKVILVDDDMAFVGTANADNRSFRLNFEITMGIADRGFAAEVEEMLRDDFTHAEPDTFAAFCQRPFYFRMGARLARLFAPVL